MNFMTTAEAAKIWGISSRRVLALAKEGRIPNVRQIGTRWMIPRDAEKPVDGRTRAAGMKPPQAPDTFRFPGFEYRPLSSFDPPLNQEELAIKAATEAFYACRYSESERLLGDLPETAEDRYIHICALYTGCMIDILCCNPMRFLDRHDKLVMALAEDFPHKAEMMEFLHEIEATLGVDEYYTRRFQLLPGYAYHDSFLPRLANLCAVSLSFAGGTHTDAELRAHELNCVLLRDSGAYADLVQLHLYLGIAYGELGVSEKQKYHLRKALTFAEKYEIYYPVSYHYYHMRKLFRPVIGEFSENFRNAIESLSECSQRQYIRFMDAMSMSSVYKVLSHGDYILLHYAVQGLSNKEIADRLHTSVGTIGKWFGDIYTLFGVDSKSALVELYHHSVGRTFPEKP